MLDHLHRPPQLLLDPGLPFPGVALIRPDMLQLREVLLDSLKDQRHGCSVLEIGRMDGCSQDQPGHIAEQMALAPADSELDWRKPGLDYQTDFLTTAMRVTSRSCQYPQFTDSIVNPRALR